VEFDHLDSVGARLVESGGSRNLVLDELDVTFLDPTDVDRLEATAADSAGMDAVAGIVVPLPRRRRQWGAERPRPPLPMQERPTGNAATWMGGLAIAATVLAWIVYLVQSVISRFIDNGIHDSRFVIQTVVYVLLMTFLLFSSFMYLLARQGALYRTRAHVRVPRAEIDAFMTDSGPSLTVLVPSYCEDPAVVRSTLLSAALQEYPGMRVVLLLDDPSTPGDPASAASLAGCRALPSEITALLSGPHERFRASLDTYEAAALVDDTSSTDNVRTLARTTPTTSSPKRFWEDSRVTSRSPPARSSPPSTSARRCRPSG
jgi:cellulose synthase (UDP-forming)